MRPSRVLPIAALAVCALPWLPTASAGERPIFTVADPRGDDHGDGSLVYPMREDFQNGELDLLGFSASADKGGTVFELTFAHAVRKPGREVTDNLGTPLNRVARFGFYTFNVDIYIDTDRVPGSGDTGMLPGRRAEIAPANAWEKAICLTPRPYEAIDELRGFLIRDAKKRARVAQGRVDAEDVKKIEHEVRSEIERKIFFPTLVWVTGSKLRFFVPESFLGGTAKDTWGYVVAVSAADLEQRVDVASLIGSERTDLGLMILPVESGRGKDFIGGGREDDNLEPPLLDILVPSGMRQEDVLKDYDLRTDRPVRLPAVIPAEERK